MVLLQRGAGAMMAFPALGFFAFGAVYSTLSLALAVLLRDDVVADFFASAGGVAGDVSGGVEVSMRLFWAAAVLLALGALRACLSRGHDLARALRTVALVLGGTALLHLGFTLFKTTMPAIVPHYADPALAQIDLWLHGQKDPWAVLDALIGPVWMMRLAPLYQGPWLIVAFLFPLALLAWDDNPERVRRYLLLYGCSWIVVGNLLALGGMSVGPVFYDRVYDATRFAGLSRMLEAAGHGGTTMGALQDYLWTMFSAQRAGFGTGISAFASVHVSVATLVALYCGERSALLAVPAGLFCGAILILSIWSGYHYAIDGYVAIATMALLWAGLRRRAPRLWSGGVPGRRAAVEGPIRPASAAPEATAGALPAFPARAIRAITRQAVREADG